MNKVDKLLKGILEEEMSAEMRTWLMELNLLIDEERALRIHDVMPSLPTFEKTLDRQLYKAGDTQDFKRMNTIVVNELWLRNFHKIAQENDR